MKLIGCSIQKLHYFKKQTKSSWHPALWHVLRPAQQEHYHNYIITCHNLSHMSVVLYKHRVAFICPSGDDVDRKFRIDEVTGLIETTATELDRETRATYTLTVSVTDSGTPQRMVSTSMRARC